MAHPLNSVECLALLAHKLAVFPYRVATEMNSQALVKKHTARSTIEKLNWPVVLKRMPLNLLRREILIPGRKFVPGKN